MNGKTDQTVAAVSAVSDDVSKDSARPTFKKAERVNKAAAGLRALSRTNTRPALVQERSYGSIISETILKGEKIENGYAKSVSFAEARLEEIRESEKTLLQSIFDGKGGVVRNKT